MKISKKILSICFSVSMLVSTMNVAAFADSNKVDNVYSETVYQEKINPYYQKQMGSVSYIYGSNRYKTAVDVSKKGWPNGSETVVLVNSKDPIYGIVATPLATSYKAPILITDHKSIPKYVVEEFKRLKPNKVIVVGDKELIDSSIVDIIRSSTHSDIVRISGRYPSDLSASVANYISEINKPDTAYVVSVTNGVADALSISSKAGEDKSPILVADKSFISQTALDYLKNNISNVYYIGGDKSISKDLVSKLSQSIPNAGETNRIYGRTRHDTNVNVINKFYPQDEYKSVVITKSDNNGLIDTVCAGPFSTLMNAPIVITEKNHLPKVTESMLKKKKTNKVYQIGGGINQNITNKIVSYLAKSDSSNSSESSNPGSDRVSNGVQNESVKPNDNTTEEPAPQSLRGGIVGKKIVVDAGHGGKDNGSTGVNSILEKNWTLKTALSCADVLRKAGAIVIMTRTGDTYPTLQDRADLSNNSQAAFFCSIHYNQGGNVIDAAAKEYSGTGAEVYKSDNDFANLAATNVLNNIVSNFDLKRRGVKDGTMLYVIRNTVAPAILVEGGFVSSRHDAGILDNDAALKKMGREIAEGIIAAFNKYK